MFTFQTPLLVTLLTPPWTHHYTAATLVNQCRLYNQLVRVGGCWRDSLRVGGGMPSLIENDISGLDNNPLARVQTLQPPPSYL